MNGGAYGGETKDVLIEARGVDRQGNDAQLTAMPRWDFPIATAACRTTSSSPRRCSRAAPAIRTRSPPRWTRSRASARRASRASRTGGSTFKNPPGHKAWKLIDEAGCRGLQVGQAQVSELHCNFLINLGGATRGRHRDAGRNRARAGEGAFRRRAGMGNQADRRRSERSAHRMQSTSPSDGRLVGRARGLAALRQGLRRCAPNAAAIASAGSTSTATSPRACARSSPTSRSTCCTAAPARTARCRACWKSSASPTAIPACWPPRWPCRRTSPRPCSRPPACRCRAAWSSRAREAAKRHLLPPPYVIKPVAEGSSVGVFIVREDMKHPPQELTRADWSFGDTRAGRALHPRQGAHLRGDGRQGARRHRDRRRPPNSTTTRPNTRPAAPSICCRRRLPPAVYEEVPAPVAGRASRARLPRRQPRRLPLRRQPRGHQGAGLPGGEYPAGHDRNSLVPELAAHAGIGFEDLVRWMIEDASLDR